MVCLAAFLMATLCAVAVAPPTAEQEAILLEKYTKLLAEEHEHDDDQGELSADEASVFDLLVGYSQLNAELEAQLAGSSDLAANLHAASRLERADAKLSKAIECFELLEKLRDERDREKRACGSFGDTILRLNSYLAGSLHKSARLALLVGQVEKEHARECAPLHPMKYKEELEKLNGEQRARLMSLLTDDLVATFMANNPSLMVDMMHGVDSSLISSSTWRNKLARAMAPELKILAAAEPELNFFELTSSGKPQFNEQTFERAFEELLKRPCQEFQRLGPEVIEPAKLDIGASLAKEQLGKDDIQLAFGLFRYELCNSILSDARGLFAADVRQVINN